MNETMQGIFAILIVLVAKFYLHWPITKFLGFILFMMIHELGHAIVAAYNGKFKRFGFQGLNPGVVITERRRDICLSGMLFNVLTLPIIIFLLDASLLEYLSLCIGISLMDLYHYGQLVRKNEGATE